MKNIFFLPLWLLFGSLSTKGQDFVDPTGTYLLKGEVRNSEIVGHYAELRVRLIDSTQLALTFYINKGYPGYESGSFVDTLHYHDNRSIYKPAADSSCSLYFSFDSRSARIFEGFTDPNSSCGFRPGVIIPAILEKTSSELPVIQDLSVHGNP